MQVYLHRANTICFAGDSFIEMPPLPSVLAHLLACLLVGSSLACIRLDWLAFDCVTSLGIARCTVAMPKNSQFNISTFSVFGDLVAVAVAVAIAVWSLEFAASSANRNKQSDSRSLHNSNPTSKLNRHDGS